MQEAGDAAALGLHPGPVQWSQVHFSSRVAPSRSLHLVWVSDCADKGNNGRAVSTINPAAKSWVQERFHVEPKPVGQTEVERPGCRRGSTCLFVCVPCPFLNSTPREALGEGPLPCTFEVAGQSGSPASGPPRAELQATVWFWFPAGSGPSRSVAELPRARFFVGQRPGQRGERESSLDSWRALGFSVLCAQKRTCCA